MTSGIQKKFRIPTKTKNVCKKMINGEKLTIEQQIIANNIIDKYCESRKKAKKNFRSLVMGLRIMNDSLVVEDGEILEVADL